jgi:predicted phage terminase large subunit-like protein
MISSESATSLPPEPYQPPPLPLIDKLIAEKSLRRFIEQAWHIIEPLAPFVPGWHIDCLCEHLEAVSAGQIKRLIVNEPPRTMKSGLISVFWPVWEWATRPTTRWMFSSYSMGLSVRDSLRCRRIIESPWYQSRWGRVYQITGDQNVKSRYENDKAGYRLATSVGGSVIGEGADILVCDDPNNLDEIHSDPARDGVNRWLDEVWSTRMNDPKTGRQVIVQQRGHERDATGHLLSQDVKWEHILLPMEFDGKRRSTSLGSYDPREEVGELLWPERFDTAVLKDLKTRLGSYGTAGQLQQTPAPAGGGIFKREHWRFYKARPAKFDEIVLSWDMTFKKTTDSDYVAGGAWGRVGADKYLIDRIKERMGFADSVKAVRAMKKRWPMAVAILVEDKANGPAIIETLQKEIPGVIAVNPEGGKEARAYAIQPEHEAGNLYLPDQSIAPWVDEYIGEMASFPRGANDDEVDQTTQAINWWRNRSIPGFAFA